MFILRAILDIIIVIAPEINNNPFISNPENKGKNRINKKTPAVTRVEEWTKAETGVGAAIAAGSQDEKGICALFVIAAKIINETATMTSSFEPIKL